MREQPVRRIASASAVSPNDNSDHKCQCKRIHLSRGVQQAGEKKSFDMTPEPREGGDRAQSDETEISGQDDGLRSRTMKDKPGGMPEPGRC